MPAHNHATRWPRGFDPEAAGARGARLIAVSGSRLPMAADQCQDHERRPRGDEQAVEAGGCEVAGLHVYPIRVSALFS
jgi:hypothetical protein